jgi:hypothetical protein
MNIILKSLAGILEATGNYRVLMEPPASHLETFLAAPRARLNFPDRADV